MFLLVAAWESPFSFTKVIEHLVFVVTENLRTLVAQFLRKFSANLLQPQVSC